MKVAEITTVRLSSRRGYSFKVVTTDDRTGGTHTTTGIRSTARGARREAETIGVVDHQADVVEWVAESEPRS